MAEMDRLESAARDFEREADDDLVDAGRLAGVIDRLQAKLCRVVERGRRRGDYQVAGLSPASWVARTCGMSRTAAADRLCVGRQLENLPEVSRALDARRDRISVCVGDLPPARAARRQVGSGQ